jgi:hypothetical protein
MARAARPIATEWNLGQCNSFQITPKMRNGNMTEDNKNTKSETEQAKPFPQSTCSAFWYAVGGLFATPLLIFILLISAIVFTLLIPVIPILLYFKRKEEIYKQNELDDEPPCKQ